MVYPQRVKKILYLLPQDDLSWYSKIFLKCQFAPGRPPLMFFLLAHGLHGGFWGCVFAVLDRGPGISDNMDPLWDRYGIDMGLKNSVAHKKSHG